jgi:folate-dependent phosphoribosylglycinamide formyltransferase PurN
MDVEPLDPGRPIRVVVFCGGPTLDPAVVRFIGRIATHPEIEFLGGFCQTNGRTLSDRVRDRLRRRGALGVAVLLLELLKAGGRLLASPRREIELRRLAVRVAERMTFVPDIHDPRLLDRLRAVEPDLGLIYGSPILKPQLFQIPRLGTIGIHHGKMPEYRGKKTTFWAVYNGDTTAGVTIQRVDAGVDTGQILRRGDVPIGRKSLGRVVRELEELGFELYVQTIVDLKRGTATPAPRTGEKGKLYRDPKASDVARFWWRQLKRRLGPGSQ